ncbi:ATP-grasp domain-containing protein [Micromonospora sp. DT4]|uniref:ATP-grasp domain-containing protein n=1 Tax=Micromonospora sp. DT4 TaxID=3393438 RepID=UPI003CFA94F1
MSRPRIMVLGGGGPASHVADWSRRIAVQAAARQIDLVMADLPENLTSVDGLPAIVETVPVDYRDPDACRLAASAVHARHPIAAVVGFREYSLIPAAMCADDLGLPWNPVAAVRTARTKDLCRAALVAAGLPQPACHRVDSPHAAAALLAELPGGRWVIKPVDAFGSEGVQLHHSGSDVTPLVEAALAFSEAALVEEFVDGQEYSAEGIIIANVPTVLEISRKHTTTPPFFVELGHDQPADLPPATHEAVVDSVVRAVGAVGLTHSLFHVEFWVTDSQRVICGEVHSRTGGDWIHALTEHRRPGLELFGSVFDDVLGRDTRLPDADPARRASVRVAVPPAGRLLGVTGVEEAGGEAGCLAVDVVIRPGTTVDALHDSFARGALVVAGTEDGTDAGAAADRIVGRLRFEVATSSGAMPS